MLTLIALLLQTAGADPCAAQQPGRTITARVISTRFASGDSLAATVCVVPASGMTQLKIGSYHGELYFDSAATVLRVEKAEGGVRVENATLKGQVNFAGAAPTGFPGRALVTVVLKAPSAAKRTPLRLRIRELNTTDGRKLTQELVVEGEPR